MLAGQTKPTEMEILFAAVAGKDPEKRRQALKRVRALSPDQIVELVWIAHKREQLSLGCIMSGLMVGAIALLWMMADCKPVFQGSLLLSVAAFVAVYLRLSDNETPHLSWRQDENIFRILDSSGAERSLEAVLLLLETAQGKRRNRLVKILLQRLPALRADDTREWTGRQKEQIKALLRSWYRHPELAIRLLKAMPEIGGTWVLKTAELLATLERWEPERMHAACRRLHLWDLMWKLQWELWSRGIEHFYVGLNESDITQHDDIYQRIRDAAAECLPSLREKAQDEEAARVLLRAADVRTNTAELLRPAADNGGLIDTTNLLRPSTPSEEIILTRRQ